MSDSKESTDDPPPYFLITDLHRMTFTLYQNGPAYRADDTSLSGMFYWSQLVEQVAEVKGSVNWESLEDRAHFLNTLYVFCQSNTTPFPLTVEPENINTNE